MSTIPIRDPRAVPPASRHGLSASHLVIGALLILIGLGWLVEVTGVVNWSWDLVLTLALIGVGIMITAEARHGTSGWLVMLGIILTAILTLASVSHLELRGGTGDRSYTPRTVADLQDTYRLGAGQMTLDLRSLVLPEKMTALTSNVGMGQIIVIVPAGVAVQIKSHVDTGNIVIFGDTVADGINATKQYTSPDYETADRRLSLDLTVGLGQIEVRR